MRTMQYRRFLFYVIQLVVVLSFIPIANVEASTDVTDSIYDDTVWDTAGSPYIIHGTVSIGRTLTIQPGTVIKFTPGSSIDVWGSVIALGTSDNPIIETSFYDDSIFGDTNNDGAATSSAAGDYTGFNLEVGSHGNFEHNTFSYATKPIEADYQANFSHTVNTFQNNTLNGIILSGYAGSLNLELSGGDAPYILADDLYIAPGYTLTLDPGVVLKPAESNVYIEISGTMTATGTGVSPVVVTALEDDVWGGDTNNNGPSVVDSVSGVCFTNIGFHNKTGEISNLKHFIYTCSDYGINSDTQALNIEDSDFSQKNATVSIQKGTISISQSSFHSLATSAINSLLNSMVTVLDSTIDAVKNAGVLSYGHSLIDVKNTSIKNFNLSGSGVHLVDHSKAILTDVTIDSAFNGVSINNSSTLEAKRVTISNMRNAGIMNKGGDTTTNSSITLKNSEIKNNNIGFSSTKYSTLDISDNSFHDNTVGVSVSDIVDQDFRNNWWGSVTGPKHKNNPSGSGDIVTDHVLYTPWLTEAPLLTTGPSNILFIPGIQGSRLYKKRVFFNTEDQLWEPNTNSDVSDLSMDTDGASLDNNIYGRDIIDQANVILPTEKIYKSIMESFDALVADKKIHRWAAVPYDWRFSPEYVVTHGVLNKDGNLSYIQDIPDGQLPYMIDTLKELSHDSLSGKVAIVTHSNGGLVAKALIKKLEEMNNAGENNLITKIDKVIMVAAPEVGTPQAAAALLHGSGTSLGWSGLFLSSTVAREFAKNVPGTYALLPSAQYFNHILNSVITFNPSVDVVANFRSVYGNAISTFLQFQNFLLGSLDGRSNPLPADTLVPAVLNQTLITRANSLHDAIDAYHIPKEIPVYEIAGWGLPTLSGIEYGSKNECGFANGKLICQDLLDETPLITHDGDKTVLSPSATFSSSNSTTYYADLSGGTINHANIFELDPLRTFIQNIATGSTDIPSGISLTKPSYTDDLFISVHSPVAIDAYDSDGNHTGIIPSTLPDFHQAEEKITRSAYMEFGEGKYIALPVGKNYQIQITGLGFGTFSFVKEHTVNDKKVDSVTFADISTSPFMKAIITIDTTGSIISFTEDIDGDGSTDATFQSGSQFDPILYLQLMKKSVIALKLPKNTERDLLRKIDAAIKLIQKNKIKSVSIKMLDLLNALSKTKGKIGKMSDADKQALALMLDTFLNNLN